MKILQNFTEEHSENKKVREGGKKILKIVPVLK